MSKVYSYRKMQAADLRLLLAEGKLQTAEAGLLDRFLDNGELEHSYTGLRDGVVFVCTGAVIIWPGRAEGWAVVSATASRWDMLWLTQRIREMLPEVARRIGLRRMEATVLAGWVPGERWAAICGFSPVALLEQYDPSGRDHRSYVKLWPSSRHCSSPSSSGRSPLEASRPSSRAVSKPK